MNDQPDSNRKKIRMLGEEKNIIPFDYLVEKPMLPRGPEINPSGGWVDELARLRFEGEVELKKAAYHHQTRR